MKITLKKFLVVTEDETELLARHSPRWGTVEPGQTKIPAIHSMKLNEGLRELLLNTKLGTRTSLGNLRSYLLP